MRLALLLLLATGVSADDGTLTIYVSPEHPYSIAYKPSVWKSADAEEEGVDLVLQHRSGTVDAALFVLEGDATLDALRENALKNGREVAPDLKVVFEARTTKDGAELLTMHMTGKSADGPVAYRGVYWAGPGKYVQLVAMTTQETDADVQELLDGLRISVEKRVPQEKRAFTMDFAPMIWQVTEDGTKDGAMMFQHRAGDTIAMAQALRVDIPKGGLRAYVLDQAKAIAPRIRVVSEQQKSVNGADVTVMHLEGTTTDGVNAVFYGYFFSGAGVYVQALTVTPVERFEQRKGDMTDFLEGLRIHLPRE